MYETRNMYENTRDIGGIGYTYDEYLKEDNVINKFIGKIFWI